MNFLIDLFIAATQELDAREAQSDTQLPRPFGLENHEISIRGPSGGTPDIRPQGVPHLPVLLIFLTVVPRPHGRGY